MSKDYEKHECRFQTLCFCRKKLILNNKNNGNMEINIKTEK